MAALVADVGAQQPERVDVRIEPAAPDHIAARIRGETSDSRYPGRGVCYLEFGAGRLAMVDVTFFGDKRVGELVGPSADLVAAKAEFGTSRVRRWFGREWAAVPA